MANIDDELIKALIQPNEFNQIGKDAPIREIAATKIVLIMKRKKT